MTEHDWTKPWRETPTEELRKKLYVAVTLKDEECAALIRDELDSRAAADDYQQSYRTAHEYEQDHWPSRYEDA